MASVKKAPCPRLMSFCLLMLCVLCPAVAWAQDGTQKWAFPAGALASSSPAIGADSTIYISSYDNLYAINPDGTQKWAFPAGGLEHSSPAIGADGTIYVGSSNGNLYAINLNGTLKWSFPTGCSGFDCGFASPAIGADGTIYAGSQEQKVYAINPNGTLKWSFPIDWPGYVFSSPAIGADGTIYVNSYNGKVYAINPDGTQKWKFQADILIFNSPAIGADGTIYAGRQILNAIAPDGTKKWTFSTGHIMDSSPAIGADGTIYIGSDDGNVYAVNPNGTQKWAFPTGRDVGGSSPAIGADGTVYVGSRFGYLYAINTVSGGLANSAWPMFKHDVRHTGFVGVPPPVAVDDVYMVKEGETLVVDAAHGVLANDRDAAGNPLSAVASLVSGASNGTLTLYLDGSFTYTPNAGFRGTDGFVYEARTVIGISDTASVTLHVNPTVVPPTVASLAPDSGFGTVTVFIQGTGFQANATVKLVQDELDLEIFGNPVNVDPLGLTIVATFNIPQLSGLGFLLDLVVQNPDGGSTTFRNAFEKSALPPRPKNISLSVEILGREAYVAGSRPTWVIRYSNGGADDALLVPLWIGGIPTDATITVTTQDGKEISPPPTLDGEEPIDFTGMPIHIETENELLIPLLIPIIKERSNGEIRVSIFGTGQDFTLRTWIAPPFSESSLSSALLDCLRTMGADFFSNALKNSIGIVPGLECAASIAQNFGAQLISLLSATERAIREGEPFQDVTALNYFFAQAFLRIVNTTAHCLTSVPGISQVRTAIAVGSLVLDLAKLTNACRGPLYAFVDELLDRASGEKTLEITEAEALDPNDKVGFHGVGDAKYLSTGQQPLRYDIRFENLPEATAPAQEVVITDRLKTGKLDQFDLNSFNFGVLTFGDNFVVPPPGVTEFSTEVDLRPGTDLKVHIDAHLDPATGLVTWRLTSIDPQTGMLPDDPFVGFLPPNREPPQGQGSVSFTIFPNEDLTTGDKLVNQASIQFNPHFGGEIISTPEWFNTLDNTRPESHVLPLAAVQHSTTFPVEWSGTDVGSGVSDYTIFVSEDEGPFAPWLHNVMATSALFTGQVGKRYAFCSVARDLAGNMEAAPEATPCIAEAVTQLKSRTLLVNDLVELVEVTTQFEALPNPPHPDAPAGIFIIAAAFVNRSTQPLFNPFFQVTELSGGNVLLNADDGPGGVGSILTAPVPAADNSWSPGEPFVQIFIIGLQTTRPFRFVVDLWGDVL